MDLRSKTISKLVGLMIAVGALMMSCIPDPLEVTDIPSNTPKIVVSSQLIPGQVVAVLLTKSIGALDANDNSDPQLLLNQIAITDATVFLESEFGKNNLTSLGNGLYGLAGATLSPGYPYTLHVISPSMGEVTATTVVKSQVRFRNVSARLYPAGRDTLAEVDYGLRDPLGINYYMINAQHLSGENLQERLLNPNLTTLLVDDSQFEGGIKEDNFKVLSRRLREGDTLAVFLANINKDYYDFMQLRVDTRFGFVDFVGEPVNYPSNVNGGLGFFNLYVPDVRFFILR